MTEAKCCTACLKSRFDGQEPTRYSSMIPVKCDFCETESHNPYYIETFVKIK